MNRALALIGYLCSFMSAQRSRTCPLRFPCTSFLLASRDLHLMLKLREKTAFSGHRNPTS
jgi:hypothetical protein